MDFKELREPWTVFGKNLFGYWLPFLGFEDVSVSRRDFIDAMGTDPGCDPVVGTMFTVEWLGKGLSLGKFNVTHG